MTKQEYRMILKLIDKNTRIIYGNEEIAFGIKLPERIMYESGIMQLIRDIKDLFEEYCKETNGAEYAERIVKAIGILQRADAFVGARKAIPLAIQVLLGADTKKYDKKVETL